MSYPKKHHYIPACYLKGFTNQGKRTSLFWAFPKISLDLNMVQTLMMHV
jgi:hypothetical protein